MDSVKSNSMEYDDDIACSFTIAWINKMPDSKGRSGTDAKQILKRSSAVIAQLL